jgi:tetratricopeptide (TPR) repeat protein
MDRQTDAIRYYHQAIAVVPEDMPLDWMLLYALGISYERNDEWQRAEDVFQKALILSNRHPLVLNYLGYSWLKHNKNPNEALYMIFEAYRQNPEDAYIMDSLGWALFRMGKYTDSVKVLERAAEYLPDNAVICDHLGDAYWQTGRLEEARYQWKHALTLKDDFNEVDPDIVRRKIKNGMQKVSVIPFNENLLVERLKGLSLD